MFNDNVDLLAEATGYSEALDTSFLEQYTSLDDMVHEMICESYEDMLRLARFEHDADMAEAKMIIQQESVEDIEAFQEGVFGKAKNFAKKIIDKIKIKWRKFCIWVNKKVAIFLMKRVQGQKDKADKAFSRRNSDSDLPTVKYSSKSTSVKKLFGFLDSALTKGLGNIMKKSITNKSGGQEYFKAKEGKRSDTYATRERATSYKKDLEEAVIGDIESTEITPAMWDISKDDIKETVNVFIKKGNGSISQLLKSIDKRVANTQKFADKDEEKSGDKKYKSKKADVTAAINASNKVISLISAAASVLRKIAWMALKAAASARLHGGDSGDYADEDETREKNRKMIGLRASSDNYEDDIDLSVF